MDIKYTNSSVEWIYSGEKKFYLVEGIEFASIGGNLINIEICRENGYEYRYISLKGDNVLWYGTEAEKVVFFMPSGEGKIIKSHKISDVAIMNDKIFIMTLETKNGKVLEYSMIGVKEKEYDSPCGYSFYRFSKMQNELSAICQGSDITADKFGRNDWKFKYNTKTLRWEKDKLSY